MKSEPVVSESSRWLHKACRLLKDGKWPNDIPVSLNASNFPIQDREASSMLFFNALIAWGRLKDFRVKNLQLSPICQEKLESVFRMNPGLESLTLVNVSNENKNLQYLSRSVLATNTQRLKNLSLENCEIRSQDAIFFKRILGMGSLESLSLRYIPLDDVLPKVVSRIACCTSLKSIEINDCRMNKETLSQVLKALASNQSVNSLTLQKCRIDSSNYGDLNQMLMSNSSVEELDLSDNNICQRAVEKITSDSLLKNTKLKSINLSSNPIGDIGATALAELLKTNISIESLSLIDCEIWGPGCLSLAAALSQMKGLRSLYVDEEMEGYADTVLASLQSNMTFSHLWMDRTSYLVRKDRKWRIVEFYLRLNRSKRRCLMEQIPFSIWPCILESVSGNASVAYYFLRHKPELMCSSALIK